MSILNLILNHFNDNLHGSGFDADWQALYLTESKNLTKSGNLKIYGKYHNMNEHGYYDGWTSLVVTIPLLDPLSFKLSCQDGKKKYTDLNRDYWEECIYNTLEKLFND